MDWDAKGLFLFSNPMEFISIYYIKHILAIHSDAWQAHCKDSSVDCTDPKFKSRLTGPTGPKP